MEQTPVCRACLENTMEYIDLEEPLFLYEKVDSEQIITYLDCFNQCTQLPISLDDEYPKYLCGSCGLELKSAYEFIVKARHSHELLQTRWEMNEQPMIEDESNTTVHDSGNHTIVEKKESKAKVKNARKIMNKLKLENVDDDINKSHCSTNEVLNCEMDNVESEKSISLVIEKSGDNEKNGVEVKENEDEEEDEAHCRDDDNDTVPVYSCEICSEHFRFQQSLQDHYTLQHPEYILHYGCDECDNRFFSKSALNFHVKRTHLKFEYVNCTICRHAVLKSRLNLHIRYMHEKRREYLCSKCPRIFKYHSSLKSHMENHQQNRERTYQCPECDKKFFTSERLRYHEAIHLKPSSVRKSFECSLCDKKYINSTNLRLHMQLHRGEAMNCPFCEKKFVRKKDMEIHIRYHTGNYPFQCKICDKRYPKKDDLMYHERKHAGHKYKCETCPKEFLNRWGLRRHSFKHIGMPLFCSICSKGFTSRHIVKRHIKCVHRISDNIDEFINTRENSENKQK